MRKILAFLAAFLFVCSTAFAQDMFTYQTKTAAIDTYHTTVGTTTAAAIPSASVYSNIIGFKICNDPVNATSTYLQLGLATDVTTDGIRLALGSCFECANCKSAILKLLKVEGQGASDGYSVIQYRP
jgi:hypothetical protein